MGKGKKKHKKKTTVPVKAKGGTGAARARWFEHFRDPWLWGIFLVALAVRGIHVAVIADMPFFSAPVIDAEMYDTRAMNMLAGITPEKIFYQAPLYSLFLAAVFLVFGHNYLAARILQIIVGAASCALVYVIGKKTFDARVGKIAGIAAALYGPMIHYDAELLRPVLVIFLALLMLWMLLKWTAGRRPAWAAGAGVFMGLSAITRENILLFAPVAVGFLFFGSRKNRWAAPAVFALAMILAILPVTIRNYIVEKDFVPISPQGGMNFYIGNGPDSDRLMGLQPGIEWDKMAFMPRDYLGADAKPSEYSSWFFRETFNYIREHPGAWLRHLCRKFVLFWTGEELTPNSDLSLFRRESPVLRILLFRLLAWVPFGVVAPLFVLGLYAARPMGEKKWLLVSFVLAYMFSLALFHVRSRYRIPVAPVMLPFAAQGALWLRNNLKSGSRKTVVAGLSILVAAALFVNIQWTDTSFARGFPTHYFIAKAYVKKEDDRKAVAEFEKALVVSPGYPELRHDYGQSLIRLGRVAEGVSQIEAARDLAPECAFIRKNLGQMYRKKADRLRAREGAVAAMDLDVDAEAQNFVEMGIREYEAAEKYDPYDTSIKYDLALLYDTGGYKDKFRSKLKEYIEEARDRPGEKEWVRISENLLKGAGAGGAAPARMNGEGGAEELPSSTAASDDAAAGLDRAQFFLRGGNLEQARKELERVIEADPRNDGAYSLLGNLYKKIGRPADAEKAYLRALEINPDNLLAHNNLANLYRDSGRFDEAERHYRKALSIAPDNAVVKKNRAQLIEMIKGKP